MYAVQENHSMKISIENDNSLARSLLVSLRANDFFVGGAIHPK